MSDTPLLPTLPSSEVRQIVQACDRFEAAWKAGPRPDPGEYLGTAAGPARSALLRQLLLLDWDYRRRAGDDPAPGDYLARFPADQDLIGAVGREMSETPVSTRVRSDGPGAADTPWFGERAPGVGGEAVAGAEAGAARYELLQEVGRGGIGVVFRGRDRRLGRELAVKVLREDYQDKPDAWERFFEEARVGSQLQHPAIVPVYEQGWFVDRRPYLTMKLVEGHTLAELLRDRADPGQELPRLLGIFEQVCQAMAYAHARGVVHRDLKPANVMFGAFGEVQVMDWGFAKVLAGDRATGAGGSAPARPVDGRTGASQSGMVMGTPAYMPPEQARGEASLIDPRADVFALGAMLGEILTGRPPYAEGPAEEVCRRAAAGDLGDAHARLDACGADVALRELAKRCLAAERAARPADAGVVAKEVTAYLASAQERLRRAEVERAAAEAKARAERRSRRLVLALAAALLLGAGVATWQAAAATRAKHDALTAKETAEKRLVQIEKGIEILGSLFADLDPNAEEKEGLPLRAILGDRLDRAAADLEGEAVGDPLVVARLQARLGQTYLGLGQAAKAEALFTKAVTTRRDHLGADQPLTLASRHDQAGACLRAGKTDEAIKRFEQVWAARARVLGADHLDTLSTLHELGTWLDGNPTLAVRLLEQVRDGRVKQLGEDHDQTLATLQSLSGAYSAAGKPTEAIALAEKVWHARVKKHGDDHPKAISALGALAFAYQFGFKMKQALALYEQAREKTVPKLGLSHPLTLKILRNLADMYRAYRRTSEAIALYEQVRERQVLILGGHHPQTLMTLDGLALAYQDDGKPDKALPLLQQAAAGVEKGNIDRDEAARIVRNLCNCHERLGQYDQAEVWRRKSLAVVKDKDGPESAAYTTALTRLGSNLLQQKKPADAEPILRECLAILRKNQPAAFETFVTQSLLGAALLSQQKYADAEPALVQGYQGMSKPVKDLGPQHHGPPTRQRLTEALERLVQLYDAWGKPEEAAKWRKELEATKASTKPPGTP